MMPVGLFARLVLRPGPNGWLMKPRWRGLSALHCCAIPVVGVVVAGLPVFWLAGVEGEDAAGTVKTAAVVTLVVVLTGSYAGFILTGRKRKSLLLISAGALAAMAALVLALGKQH